MKPSEKSTAKHKTMTIDRRASERKAFPASAVLTDKSTDSRHQVRISDLGRGGCYVDLMNPSPVGTPVTIVIRHANKTFEARGTVIYALPPMGMGVSFTEIAESHQEVLESWLGVSTPSEQPSEVERSKGNADNPQLSAADGMNREVLRQLVTLLMRQRVISESQAVQLLRHLVAE